MEYAYLKAIAVTHCVLIGFEDKTLIAKSWLLCQEMNHFPAFPFSLGESQGYKLLEHGVNFSNMHIR